MSTTFRFTVLAVKPFSLGRLTCDPRLHIGRIDPLDRFITTEQSHVPAAASALHGKAAGWV
jgi:hypothetical protein